MKLHLDGARLFNVLVETNEQPQDVGKCFDSISICISKGLGAPVGSLLVGTQDALKRARKLRKVMGGGMRQAGYLAAACTYALDNHIEDLKIDNARAKEIGHLLEGLDFVNSVKPVMTNIVIFKLQEGITSTSVVELFRSKGLNSSPFAEDEVRFVFHRDITEDDMSEIPKILKDISV